jgi:hypothetical protein
MTVLDIYNLALATLSHDRILTAVDEDAQEATRCNLFYPRARLDVFTAHPWNFLQIDCPATLQADVTLLPPFEYAYAAPTDALFIADATDTDGERPNFVQRGGILLSDGPIDTISYTVDNENPDEWPEPVRAAVVAALAFRLARPMGANARMTQDAYTASQETLAAAKHHDQRTNRRTTRPMPSTSANSPYKAARA